MKSTNKAVMSDAKEEEEVVYKTPFPISGAIVSNSGRRYRLFSKSDFLSFRGCADSLEGFSLHLNRANDVIVWTKKLKGEPLSVVKVFSVYPGVSPLTMYDMMQDAEFRIVWDAHRIEGFCIAKLSFNNDIGYYAAKSPVTGVANRDFVNQRAWHNAGGGEYIIFNTSVPHHDIPLNFMKVKKNSNESFVRGFSKITGYLIRPWENNGETGCCITYITQCDPGGWIPSMVMNYVTTKASPNTVKTLREAVGKFASWASQREAHSRAWASEPDPFETPMENLTIQFAKEKWATKSS